MDVYSSKSLSKDGGGIGMLKDRVVAPTYAGDAAKAISGLIARNASGTYNFCQAGETTRHRFLEKAFELFSHYGVNHENFYPERACDRGFSCIRRAAAV
jgi:dTDP-4-dehydrorhamnose reductase